MSKSKKYINKGNLIDFDKQVVPYPPQEEFPLNIYQFTVLKTVSDDIAESSSFLVVTGFKKCANYFRLGTR